MVFIRSKNLLYMATAGAAISVGMSLYVVRQRNNIYRDSKFFEDAMNILESHAGAVSLLGSPIKASQINFVTPESKEPSLVAEFSTFVKGSKSSGVMHFWAERSIEETQIRINISRVELELAEDKNKRLVVKSGKTS